nr:hypothetical protein CFP56_57247 [Quercus suber]
MVKQKKSMDGGGKDERADWKDPKELEAFCWFCAVQVMDGQRKAIRFLSKIGVNEVIRQLGYDAGTGMFDTPDEWWNQKIAACPNAKTFKIYDLPNRDLLNIMFGGTVATWRNVFCTSGPIPTETNEGSGYSADSVEFVDPQCDPVVNVDAMEVEGPSSSRAGPAVNKGKSLATSVHIFKPISKKPKKKRSTAQEMSDSLKSISNVLVERSSLSAHTPSIPTATAQVKAILDMVLSLPGVYSGHYLHMFSTIYFMKKEQARHMFQAISDNKEIQLKWLEKEYLRHPEYH